MHYNIFKSIIVLRILVPILTIIFPFYIPYTSQIYFDHIINTAIFSFFVWDLSREDYCLAIIIPHNLFNSHDEKKYS